MTRAQFIQEHFPEAPAFRLTQLTQGLFSDAARTWTEITGLPQEMRATLAQGLPWLSVRPVRVLESVRHDTLKAVVEAADGARFETVLMRNPRGQWSLCVSSQVGCAMACTFCATGKMGFTRNLTEDEIVDQYRFWKEYVAARPALNERISNIVFMGMGEPLANYVNVRATLRTLLDHTDLGPTRITVSTVGLVPMLEKLLDDPEWPPVRLAVSLHSADEDTRKAIMPTSYDGFLDKLAGWAEQYFAKFESRRRHLTFEYIMLAGVNDTPHHADCLVRFSQRVGKVRVNLIPYNTTASRYTRSVGDAIADFKARLEASGVTVTARRTMGDDIAAACGQLIVEKDAAPARMAVGVQ